MSNGSAGGSAEASNRCMICQESSSIIVSSCCALQLCKSCFDSIKKHHDDIKKPTICPNCQKPITALVPILQPEPPGDKTKKRAEIAARVAKARQEQAAQAAQEALMEQFISMFVQGAKSVTEKFEKIGKNPQKVPKSAQGAILRGLRNLLKKPWASSDEFCKEFGQTFKDYQSEFAEGSGPWQHLVGCWDFQTTHLLAIKEWYDTLPKGTVLLDPSAGKGLLAACLNVFDIPVVCNDIESQESPFVTGMSTMDGIQFLESYIAPNPETPVAIVLSWAPQKGHSGEHFSEAIFRFGHRTRNVLGVIHISEGWMGGVPGGRIGCTDTVEALVLKAEHFQTILDLPREYPPQWSFDGGMPIDDHLTINVPKPPA
jgi:hypothetical protein